ncbi:two-component system response regulator [Sphingomonas sp. Root710]|uniref:response regulator n=1 Tax=Sphingomonas sp. Root710 TaxID=1736594 RepID=UPI0006F32BFB|nr:response regulator [Sphingomonas sp. Root710]KRB85737.1 two-component system response regulator [Sphingomonas sp. Root710]
MKTCLVVDDSKVIRKVARHILEALQFNVEEAGDGREALDRCTTAGQELPDVILLDWNMPVMTGMEFLRSLGASGIANRPKVVFCTTENDVAHIRAAIDAGADEYMMKPFDRETLESKLQLVGVA